MPFNSFSCQTALGRNPITKINRSGANRLLYPVTGTSFQVFAIEYDVHCGFLWTVCIMLRLSFCGTRVLIHGLHLKPLLQLFCVMDFSERVSQIICPGLLQTVTSWSLSPKWLGLQAWATVLVFLRVFMMNFAKCFVLL
jgi:hypothetical protein